MKKVIFSLAVVGLIFASSCKKDDDSNSDDGCQTCDAFDIKVNGETQTTPEQEVCEGDNGNAFVNGVDTMQTFSDYITAYELLSDCN